MNVNEYGVVFCFLASFDMASYTGLTLTFTKPSGSVLVATEPDVSIVNASRATPLGTAAANTYALYTFQAGDVDEVGVWSARLTFDNAVPQHLISNLGAEFTVDP